MIAPSPTAAVVILNYNGAALLQQFLPLVIRYSGNASIIVADNASTDESVAILSRDFPGVRLIQLDANYGFCGGYNRALQQAKADYYILLNSDVEVTPGWTGPLIHLLTADITVAAVQPKIRAYHLRGQFEHAGAAGGFIDALGYPFCRGRIFDTVEEDHGQYDEDSDIFWATGACLAIRATAFHQFGGFDEDYFAHMEEIDLCWKLRRSGQRVRYVSASVVYHIGAGTLAYGSSRKIFLNFRNGLLMLFKHLSTTELFYKMPIRFFLDYVAAVKFLAGGKWKNSAAIFQAHVAFIGNLTREIAKRRVLHRAYPTYKKSGIVVGSIVLNYYVMGRKKFSDQ